VASVWPSILSCLRFATLPWAPVLASSCCCQVQSVSWGLCMAFNFSCLRSATLPWAPVPPPHAAARPVICHGPLYPPPHAACQVQSVSRVPVQPPIAAVSIATLCHVPLSGLLTLLVGSILS
ncbi:unnamed protein product, partial [Staurois parvus]